MGDALSVGQAASLDAESFRVYYLSDLLRRARARMVVPKQFAADCPSGVGLTQEHTARLLATAERHYRDFERGRVVHPEARFLDQVARVLEMSAAEREALYRLAARRPPLSAGPSCADIRDLQPMLDAMEHTPALATDIAWNLLAWNRALIENLQDPRALPEEARNTILWMFGPTASLRFPRVRDEFGLLVGRVRSAYLAGGGRSPALQGLVERLVQVPEAEQHWNSGALALEPVHQPRLLDGPALGTGRVRTLSTLLPTQGLRVIQFVPETVDG